MWNNAVPWSSIIIGSGNDLSPIQHRAITQTNVHLLSSEPLKILIEISLLAEKTFFLENSFQNVNCKMSTICSGFNVLTHWGRVTHICVGKLTIIGSDNVLSPGRRQAIIWTNAGILLIEPLGTNFSEILIGIQIFSFKKMRLKMSSAKWRPFCLGLNVLKTIPKPSGVGHGNCWEYTCHSRWCPVSLRRLGPLFLIWIHFNPSMEK